MNILHIDSSILGNQSVTRDLSAMMTAQTLASHPTAQVSYRDLAKEEIKHLTGAIAAGFRQTGVHDIDEAIRQEHRCSEALVTEFLSSDVLIIGAPMYNFSIPSQLKAWLDRIAQVGRTFQYTAKGPIGLAGGKRVIVISARGGFYANSPLADMDFQEGYLETFFNFLGITDIQFIRAEGISKGEEIRETQIASAKASIATAI